MKPIILFIIILFSAHPATALTGMYTELSTGISTQNELLKSIPFDYQQKHTNPFRTGRAGIGYIHDFDFGLGFGFEAGYGNFTKTTYEAYGNVYVFSSDTLEFLLVFKTYMDSFDFYMKFGGIRNTLNFTKNELHKFRVDQQPQFCFGSGYNFDEHLALTLSYQFTFGGPFTKDILPEIPTHDPSLREYLFGARFTFF